MGRTFGTAVILGVILRTSVLVLAQPQADQQPPAFEVVSVKPVQPNSRGGPGPFVNTDLGKMHARGPLIFFIEFAYGIREAQIEGGAGWMRAERFDIDAVLPPGVSVIPRPSMLQPVLAERFGVVVHRLTREASILALVVAKSGPKLRSADAGDEGRMQGAPGQLIARRVTMRQLASQLSRIAGAPVEDRTNLSGEYSLTLRWTADVPQRADPAGRPAADPDAPSLVTALQEQLGLTLERTRGSIEVLVVDRAERPRAD